MPESDTETTLADTEASRESGKEMKKGANKRELGQRSL